MADFVILDGIMFIIFFLLIVINSQALSCQSSFKELGESCYRFEIIELKTFQDAMADCQSSQAHLVYIETSDEWTVIQDKLPKEHMWIGLSGLTEEEATWGDGYASITYENFSPKAFDEMSGCFYIKDGPGEKWVSGPCLDLHGYICEEWTVDKTTTSDATTLAPHTTDMTFTSHGEITTFSTSHTTDIISTQQLSQNSGSLQDAGCEGKYYIGNQFILVKTNFAIQNVTAMDISSPKGVILRCATVCIRTARCEGFVGNQLQKYCSLITNEQLEQGVTFIPEDGALYYKLENI